MRYEILDIDETAPHDVATTLSQLDKNDCDGIAIMAIEHPEIRDAITRLTERGVPVVSLVSYQSAAMFCLCRNTQFPGRSNSRTADAPFPRTSIWIDCGYDNNHQLE